MSIAPKFVRDPVIIYKITRTYFAISFNSTLFFCIKEIRIVHIKIKKNPHKSEGFKSISYLNYSAATCAKSSSLTGVEIAVAARN